MAPLNSTEVDWTANPNYSFDTEVEGLEALIELGDHLRAARREVEETMRYLRAAVIATRENGEGTTQAQAIINHSGLSRRTVYQILGLLAPAPTASRGEAEPDQD